MLGSLFGRNPPDVERAVRLYFGEGRCIVAAMHRDPAGLYFEQESPSVIEAPLTATAVGRAFAQAFSAFSPVSHPVPIRKRSDWPAYRASGAPSMKAFEAAYLPMLCSGLNPSNAVVRASVPHPAGGGLEIAWHFNPLLAAEAIGGGLLRLVDAARA